MARRSPLNKRYQKDTKVGSTRKSAAAAKPKRSNASGSSSSSSSRSKTRSNSSRRLTPKVQLSPEVKRLQKFSFGMLGVAVVLSVIYLWKFRTPTTVGYIIIGLAYALMFGALFIDFAKVRPAIKAAQRGEKRVEASGTSLMGGLRQFLPWTTARRTQSSKDDATKKEAPEKKAANSTPGDD